jgi:hypothetical protein
MDYRSNILINCCQFFSWTGSRLPYWTENASRQAEVQTAILDRLYRDLPRPPFTDVETDEIAERVYGYVWQRSASGESFNIPG